MAKNSITDYSKTASLNTDIQSVDIDEGCLPSGINNAIRELMADLAAVNDGTVSLTSPSFAAASLTGNLSFGDNDKAIFGAGSDLQIYHDGSNSIIQDSGTGDLILQGGNDLILRETDGVTEYLRANEGAGVQVYHNGSQKLLTTATGIDVTGTVTADGLTVEAGNNPITFSTDDSGYIKVTHPTRGGDYRIRPSGTTSERLDIQNGTQKLARFSSSGDISFYEDTGTTAKLFWDASAEFLGLGTTNPDTNLHVYHGTRNNVAVFESGDADVVVYLRDSNSTNISSVGIGATTDDLTLRAGNAERLRITSAGLVGIGTNSPATALDVNGEIRATNRYLANTGGGATKGYQFTGDGNTGMYSDTSDTLQFSTAGSERMRIDSSGNLLVGKTTTSIATAGHNFWSDGLTDHTRSGEVLRVNRLSTDGDIVTFRKDGTTVGSIGVVSSDNFYIAGNSSHVGGIAFGTTAVYPCTNTGAIDDNANDLGDVTVRWDDVYATNGTIQTSDANEKQQIASLTDAEMTAAKAISKLFKTFKWNDKVEAKGDAARTHTGVIAQDVQQAMTDAGLDAGDYAFFISTTWWETQTEVPAVEADEENGIEAQDAYTRTKTYETAEEAPEGATERTRLGIRYPELLAFVGAATEQRLADIETRLTTLEGN